MLLYMKRRVGDGLDGLDEHPMNPYYPVHLFISDTVGHYRTHVYLTPISLYTISPPIGTTEAIDHLGQHCLCSQRSNARHWQGIPYNPL